jgi:hypothetical protein
MSVQLSPHSIGQSAPRFRQAIDLLSFDRVIHGDLLEQRDFISHDLKVSNRPLPCSGHICVSVEGLAAERYARVGFGRGHGGYND